MTDRDHFAAAALTGLLASREWPIDSDEAAHYCYRVADAMLRERAKTNHDAAPAATASVESVVPQPTTHGDSDRTDKAAPRPSEGTGDTPKPISGCVSDRPTPIASEQEPVAWAVRYRHGDTGIVDLCRTLADCRAKWSNRTTDYWLYEPLYRHPPCQDISQKNLTLTDAEREAVLAMACYCDTRSGLEWVGLSATLRGLLERTK